MNLTILLESGAKVIDAQPGQTILDAVRAQEGLPVHAPCGGQGTCGKCTVYLSGPEGETAVLACRTPAEDGMTVRLPSAAPLAVQHPQRITLSPRSDDVFHLLTHCDARIMINPNFEA